MVMGALRLPIVFTGAAGTAVSAATRLCAAVLAEVGVVVCAVIAGASAIPSDLKEAAGVFDIRGWQWWRSVILPAIFPYYVTGAITASGGSWNASIVAEAVSWGNQHLEAAGLGSYISHATGTGDFRRTVVGIVVMALFVVVINRVFWKPLFARAERKFRLS